MIIIKVHSFRLKKMTEKSLIITNTLTKEGYKTFTYRWYDNQDIGWADIFKFIRSKTGFAPNYYTAMINGRQVKYNELKKADDFDLDNFVYYEMNGNKTSTGTVSLGINLHTLVHNNVIFQW